MSVSSGLSPLFPFFHQHNWVSHHGCPVTADEQDRDAPKISLVHHRGPRVPNETMFFKLLET